MNPTRSAFAAIACLFLALAGQSPVMAQAEATGTATVSGTVVDPNGKTIAKAAVALTNEASGSVRLTTTAEDGAFALNSLPAGVYSLNVSATGFSTDSLTGLTINSGVTATFPIKMRVGNVSDSITVQAEVTQAVEAAPSQSSLDAKSAVSIISSNYIRNFIASTGDYSDVLQMSPGTFSVSPNGPGLGDTKTFFRGFKDGIYNMTYDGLPFNDTNDPTHHSWVWFPTPFIGSTVFDRSPGDATSIGPANSGGSVNLLSREATVDQNFQATVSYGSFNTRMVSLDYDSGMFGGKKKKSSLILNGHNLMSDGYQTYNYQNRWAGMAKYQYRFTDKTILTAYTAIVDLASNTPNVKGPTRAQVAQFGNNYLLNNDPTSALYYKYSFYQIPTDFDYVGLASELGHGWKLDEKAYSNRYYNHQQYNGNTITPTSGTDKLNSYRKVGNTVSVSQTSKWGTFRTGFWYEWANTDRFQIPTDPRTWVDVATPNFHEKFITQSSQPFAQYEWHATKRLVITAGFKMSNYNVHLNQFADNGKTIGCLGGKVVAGICSGGLAFVSHTANYRAWQPTVDARYRLKNNWSVYTQWATGNVIPPSSVFDTVNATVAVTPKPTQTKAFQFGSVWKNNRFTFDADAYFIHAQNAYASAPDANGNPVYFQTPDTFTKGFEVEGNAVLGKGLFLYANGTIGSAKYTNATHLWVASSPHDTETVGLTYLRKNWDLGFFNKRIGQMYNDNGGTHQAVALDPFNITNLYLNYTVKQASFLRGTKFRVGFNNLFNNHSLVGVTPASTSNSAPAPGDFLSLMAGRSVSVAMTFGYAPKR